MDIANVLLRWIHVFAGIIWIGFLFFFSFVYTPSIMALGPDIMRSTLPSVAKKVTSWIGGAVGTTYLTGLLLLGMVFHGGGIMFEEGYGWGTVEIILVALVFLMFVPYDIFAKSSMGGNPTLFAIVLSVVGLGFVYVATDMAGFTYRSAMIHAGIMFGTIMGANGAMRVVPAQRRMVESLEAGGMPDPKDLQTVQRRAMHNTYLAIPMVYTMINQHTVVPGASSHAWFLGVLVVSAIVVSLLHRSSRPAAAPHS